MTPFSQYKGWLAEGGIRNALIVSGPAVKRPKGSINHGSMHVADIMPTLLEVAGTAYPKAWKGRELPPLLGKSWVPMLEGQAESPRTDRGRHGLGALRQPRRPAGDVEAALAGQALRQGRVGALRRGGGSRRAEGPRGGAPGEAPKEMVALWDDYVRTNHVVLPSRTPFETMEKLLPQRVPDDAGFPPLTGKRQFVPPANMLAEPKE